MSVKVSCDHPDCTASLDSWYVPMSNGWSVQDEFAFCRIHREDFVLRCEHVGCSETLILTGLYSDRVAQRFNSGWSAHVPHLCRTHSDRSNGTVLIPEVVIQPAALAGSHEVAYHKTAPQLDALMVIVNRELLTGSRVVAVCPSAYGTRYIAVLVKTVPS